MLKENIKENVVVSIKLGSGEEIIALLNADLPDLLKIEKPLLMILTEMPNNNSQGGVVFAPFMLGADDDTVMPISKDHIITYFPSPERARTPYAQAIGLSNTPKTPTTSETAISGGRGGRGGASI